MPPADLQLIPVWLLAGVRMQEAWAVVVIDDHRALIYGPRFGRLYLLPSAQATDSRFRRVIGLSGIPRSDALVDPVERIVHDRRLHERQAVVERAPLGLSAVYRIMLLSRRLVPLRTAAVLSSKAARLRGLFGGRSFRSSSEIGRLICAIETRVGVADCYPRALMTTFLCLAANRACMLAVGVLSPTRKMHAWCVVDGDLPYEALPEHYLYQPLWMLTFSL